MKGFQSKRGLSFSITFERGFSLQMFCAAYGQLVCYIFPFIVDSSNLATNMIADVPQLNT